MSQTPRLPPTVNVEIASAVPGTPARPCIFECDVYVQGTKYGVSMPSSIVSSTDYATTAELSPAEVSTASTPTRGKYVCTTITPATLTELLEVHSNVVDLPHWNYVTHIVYQGLNVTPAGKVTVEGDGRGCRVIGSAFTYLQLLYAIKRAHPHLSLVWSFPAPFKRGVFMERMIMEPASLTFWSTLDKTLHQVQADGCELNLEHVSHFPANFISDLIGFGHRARLHLVLNNRVQWRHDNALAFLNCMQSLVGKIVVNSFGYFEYIVSDAETVGPRIMVRSRESALYNFEMSLYQLLGTVPRHKILMGIDTCGVLFKSGPHNQAELSLVSLREIQRIFQMGLTDDNDDNIKWTFNRHVDTRAGASCMTSRCPRGACPFISYDSYQIRRMKVKFAVEQGLGGVNMGDLSNDLFCKNRRSLAHICRDYLVYGLPVDADNDEEFCDNDDECDMDSVFIIEQ